MDPHALDPEVEEITELLERKFRVRAPTLEARIRKTGRRLPKARRRDAEVLVGVARQLGHPKLSRQADIAAARDAAGRLRDHLKAYSRKEMLTTRTLNTLAVIAANLILVFVVFVWIGVERGWF